MGKAVVRMETSDSARKSLVEVFREWNTECLGSILLSAFYALLIKDFPI